MRRAGFIVRRLRTVTFGLLTPFTEPHDFLFNMYHPKGTRNTAEVNDTRLTASIEQEMKNLDRAGRKQQIFDIQRYLAEQMYYPMHAAPMRTAALQPNVRDFYPRSDFGLGAEVVPKLWMDQAQGAREVRTHSEVRVGRRARA